MARRIILIVGARPNFMKAAPLMDQLQLHPDKFETLLVHTGQHYNYELSKLFFEQLKMREPDVYLGVGSDSHARQTANIMIKIEELLIEREPELVVVFGDVNSTMAASIVVAKLRIGLAHVEAGLRSFDFSMPEEINRVVTDRLSQFLFVTEESGIRNLRIEGVPEENIFFVGNIMIDSLINNIRAARKSGILDDLKIRPGEYAALTLHRPANVDDEANLRNIFEILAKIGKDVPIVFPCHPRTRKNLEKYGLMNNINSDAIKILDPIGYLDFLKLQSESKFVLTDSGGIQEETTFMKIPCITLRENTERPATVEIGSNTVTGLDEKKIMDTVHLIARGEYKNGRIPELWDGKTALRITEVLCR